MIELDKLPGIADYDRLYEKISGRRRLKT